MSKSNAKEIESRLRKERNRDIVRRMKNGETLTTFSSAASWFPPRPTIEKDRDAILKLYGQERGESLNATPKASDDRTEGEVLNLTKLHKAN